MVDIEIEQREPKQLAEVHNSVMESYGPSDPTIVIRIDGDDDEADVEIDIEELMEALDEYGNVILFR